MGAIAKRIFPFVIPTGGRNLLFAAGEESRFLTGLRRFGMTIVEGWDGPPGSPAHLGLTRV